MTLSSDNALPSDELHYIMQRPVTTATLAYFAECLAGPIVAAHPYSHCQAFIEVWRRST